jgi:tetratricopeptide (TPR) repeat protein
MAVTYRRAGMLALLIVSSSPALSQIFVYDQAHCTDVKLPPERRIESCTRLLEDGGGPDREIAALAALGGLYRGLHQYAQAIDSYSRAVGYEALGVADAQGGLVLPGQPVSLPSASWLIVALEGRAEVYALTGRPDLALADMAHVFKLAPDSAASYAARCRIWTIIKTGLDKALADCDEAMKLAPKDTQVLGTVGLLQYQLGHLKEAAADFGAVLNDNPKLAGALYMRGVIRLRSGDAAGGNADIAEASEEYPGIEANFADLGVTP